MRIVRSLPFIGLAVISLWIAGQAPHGRHSPTFNWAIHGADISRVLTAWPQILWMFVLFLFAALAAGRARLWFAALITLVVGFGWEIAETTVAGRNAEIVGLIPDSAGILAGWLLVGLLLRKRRGTRLT